MMKGASRQDKGLLSVHSGTALHSWLAVVRCTTARPGLGARNMSPYALLRESSVQSGF